MKSIYLAIIGAVGIPNRYGGFESFLESCAPELAKVVDGVEVTCDPNYYSDLEPEYLGVKRTFIPLPANGIFSVIHDLVAFIYVYRKSTHIIVLGVSGGLWFPIFRLLCTLSNKTLVVNVDGIEWRRAKHSKSIRTLLHVFDYLAQKFSHYIIVDNLALLPFIPVRFHQKCTVISYPGDHIRRMGINHIRTTTALTICRIEPENSIDLLIEGVVKSQITKYTIIGNWSNSTYGSKLKRKWSGETKLNLLDPIYDSELISQFREECEIYLHGHSVGGTNPSLVEMLFYDCRILCYDCSFNRITAGLHAEYFHSSEELHNLINEMIPLKPNNREPIRQEYSKQNITTKYLHLLRTEH